MSDEKTKSKKGRTQNVMVTEQDLPAVQLGVEVLTDNGQLELQKPPEKPFTIGDYSNLLAFGGDKEGAEELTRKAKDALTKEGKQMAEDFQSFLFGFLLICINIIFCIDKFFSFN